MMAWCIVACAVVGFFSTSLMAVPARQDNGDIVQVAVLEEASPDHRVRRTADSNLPDHLSCGFPFHKDNVVLRLKRSRLLPVVTSDAGHKGAVNRMDHNSAVYTDSSAGSAMIVKRVNGEYSLEGSFFHHNKEWKLQPLSKLDQAKDNSRNESYHRIFPVNVINTTISFVNDVIQDTEDKRDELDPHALVNNGAGLQQTGTNRTVHGHRHRRATTTHVIEVAFVVDFEDYSKWTRHVGAENAISAMRLWYTFTAESINIRYQTIKDPDIAISTRVTVLKIITNPNDAMFISNLVNANGVFRGSDALNAFRKWYLKQADLPLSDHYMLMTGYDVMGSSGIAISSRLCTEFSTSICENSFTASLGGVAAHELGHSLSAVHDIDTPGPHACTDSDQYIMATVLTSPVAAGNEGNPWRFSPCSIKSIKAYLNGVSCTLPQHTSGVNELPVPNESDRAGQVLLKNAQCVLAFRDSKSSFCNTIQTQNGGLQTLCGGMYCSIPNDWQGACQTVVPQEFTSCGIRKWCVTGRCVDMDDPTNTSTASSTSLTTPSTFTLVETPTTARPTTRREPLRTTGVTNTLTIAQKTTTSSIPSTHAKSIPAVLTKPTQAATPTTPTTTPSIERATAPLSAHSTPPGLADVSMCNYLIYMRKGTDWWHCVQRALGRTEMASPRPVRRIPVRRTRIYIRRFHFYH